MSRKLSINDDEGGGGKQKRLSLKPKHALDKNRVSVLELLKGRNEITLEHMGQDYTLRITRNGKLILTK